MSMSDTTTPTTKFTPQFIQYSYRYNIFINTTTIRYVIVVLFAIPNISNAMVWITCAPITSQIQKAYGVSGFEVALCSSLFMIAYLIFNFPADYILDTYGCRPGIIIGTILTILGACMRVFIDHSFAYVLVGQTLAAMGQPFILNAPAKLANCWFLPTDRPMATSVLSVINLLGTGIGFLLPGLIVGDDQQLQREKIKDLMVLEAFIIAPACLLTLIFMRNKPKTPPSISAQTHNIEFVAALKQLSFNKDYLILFVSFSLVLGNFNTFSTLIEQIIEPFGYNDVDSSLLGGLLIGFGIFGATILSLIVQKRQNYKNLIIFCCFSGVLLNLAMIACLYYNQSFSIFAVAIAGVGFLLCPIIPLSFDLACELSFPIGEAVSAGMLMTGGQLIGVLQIGIFSYLPSSQRLTSFYILIVSVVLYVLSGILMLFLEQKLNRTINEKYVGIQSFD